MNEQRNFTIRSYSYYNSQNLIPEQRCYGWLVVNFSDAIVRVNEYPLMPAAAPGLQGGSFGFIDNRGDSYYRGNITIAFDAAVTIPLLVLVQIMEV